MTATELKQELLNEHKRDVRLTLINYTLISIVAIAIIALVYFFAFNQFKGYVQGILDFFANEKNRNNYSISLGIGAVIILSTLGFFVANILAMRKRPQSIDLLIEKIENGVVANNIYSETVYKIVIPLLKIKLNLFPMEMVKIYFPDEVQPIELPVANEDFDTLKTLLSGVNQNEIAKAWYELYDGESTSTESQSALKSDAEFEQFVATDLQKDLDHVENQRSKGMSTFIKYLIPTLLVVGAWLFFQYSLTTGKVKINPQHLMMGFIGLSFLYYIIIYFSTIRPNRNKPVGKDLDIEFKTKILNKIIHFINPNFKYILHGHISLPEFLEMGFFERKHYDLSGNDQVIGKHSGVPFQLCDLSVSRTLNFSNEKDAPDAVFSGQIFIAKFNKQFKNDVYLIPKKIESLFNTDDTSLHLEYLGEKVQLEDPEFMKLFSVYAKDQVEARYILSTSLMQRIKDLAKNKKDKYLISFRNNRISIANHSNKNNFEISMFKSITKTKQTQAFYQELCAQLKIIDDLKLNINIWK